MKLNSYLLFRITFTFNLMHMYDAYIPEENEIISRGNTAIFPIGYLIVLINENRVSKINDALIMMTENCEVLK